MFKKKRIALLLVLAVAIYAGYQYGAWLAVAGLTLLALMLGGLSLWHYIMAHRGLSRLQELSTQLHWEKLLERVKTSGANPQQFAFVVLGDTRNKKKITSGVYEQAAAEKPTMVFHTGDIIRHGTAQEYLRNHIPLLEITDPAPMFCVPGNHERGARRDFAAFKTLYGSDRFSFAFGPCRFVGFNNSTKKRVDEDDLAYLDRELADPDATHKFLFFHIPPVYFEERFAKDERRRGFKKNADAFHKLLVKHQVTEAFMAHIHGYASEVIDGVRYTLTAGGGAPLSGRLAAEGQAYNYVVLHVSPDSLRRESVRCINGQWTRG